MQPASEKTEQFSVARLRKAPESRGVEDEFLGFSGFNHTGYGFRGIWKIETNVAFRPRAILDTFHHAGERPVP
jgi:hypothetical protein